MEAFLAQMEAKTGLDKKQNETENNQSPAPSELMLKEHTDSGGITGPCLSTVCLESRTELITNNNKK